MKVPIEADSKLLSQESQKRKLAGDIISLGRANETLIERQFHTESPNFAFLYGRAKLDFPNIFITLLSKMIKLFNDKK